MILRKTKLRNAILFALAAGATSMAGTGIALAQDQNQGQTTQQQDQNAQKNKKKVTELKAVTVTGSRLNRAQLEGAMPVIVMDRAQIDATGEVSVADFLRTSNINSTGQFRPQSGSSAQAGAFADLRGLGGNRTLVLVDGHRAPKAPFAASSGTDLNAIPMAAVERIEVLTDGASAIYGADAVGGVINIITRKDFNGGEVKYGMSKPNYGGDTKSMSAVWGASGDRGHVLIGISKSNRDMVFTKDAPFPYVKGASAYGNNYAAYDPVTGESLTGVVPVKDGCNEPNFYINPSNGWCVYDFNATAANMASSSRRSIFANGQTQLNDNWLAYFNAGVTNTGSFGRYAPTPGVVKLGPDSAGNPVPGAITYLYHRYVGAGNRDNSTDSNVYSALIGLKGHVGENIDLDFGIRYDDYVYNEFGTNYIVAPLAVQAINNGSLDYAHPSQNSQDVLNGIKATITRQSFSKTRGAFGSATFNNLFTLGGGTASLVVGGDYRDMSYADVYDSLSSAGVILGSAGASAGQKRDVKAVYAEMLLPFTDSFSADLAARYEDYSDFGSSFSPKLGLRWQALDNLTFRGSVGKGFVAPGLDTISQDTAYSADFISDPATCQFYGVTDPAACDRNGIQVDAYREKAVGLGPEKSTQYSIGAVWDATSWMNFTLDLWNIEIKDRIAFFGSQKLVNIDLGLDPTPMPGAPCSLERDPARGNAVVEIHNCYFNEGIVKTNGADFAARTHFDLGNAGRISNVLRASYSHKYTIDGGDTLVGTQGFPRIRATMQNSWNKGIWGANLNVRYIGPNGTDTLATRHYTTYDLQGRIDLPWNGTLSVGVNNFTNKLPQLIGYDGRPYNFYLYDAFGRTPYIHYTQRF